MDKIVNHALLIAYNALQQNVQNVNPLTLLMVNSVKNVWIIVMCVILKLLVKSVIVDIFMIHLNRSVKNVMKTVLHVLLIIALNVLKDIILLTLIVLNVLIIAYLALPKFAINV